MDDLTIAAAIAATINEDDSYLAKVWTGGRHIRVYITQFRSRGRTRDIGHLSVSGGTVEASLSVQKGHFRNLGQEIADNLIASAPQDSGAMPVSTERVVDLGDDHLPSGTPRQNQAQPTCPLPATTADEPYWHDPEDPSWDPTRIHEVQ